MTDLLLCQCCHSMLPFNVAMQPPVLALAMSDDGYLQGMQPNVSA